MIRFRNDYTHTSVTFNELDISEIELKKADVLSNAYEIRYHDTVLFQGSKKGAEKIAEDFRKAILDGYNKHGLIQIHSNAYESVGY